MLTKQHVRITENFFFYVQQYYNFMYYINYIFMLERVCYIVCYFVFGWLSLDGWIKGKPYKPFSRHVDVKWLSVWLFQNYKKINPTHTQ